MKNSESPFDAVAGTIRWGAALAALVVVVALGSLIPVRLEEILDWFIAGLALLGICTLAFGLAGKWLAASAIQYSLLQERQASSSRIHELKSRLGTLQQLNGLLAEAQDERELMKDVLGLIANLTGAQAASYVPLDEWGQPLASIQSGEPPPAVVDAWMAHLASPGVTQICKHCQVRQGGPGPSCPLAGHPFRGAQGIFCYPVQRGERNLGMVNLYVPETVRLSPETGEFLEGLLAELALAVETVRLRNQELKTLRQIQLVRNPRMDLPSLMANLLENARQALEVDYALVLLRSSGRNAARLIYGNDLADQLESERVRELLERTLDSGEEFSLIHDDPARLPAGIASILAVPVKLPEQKPFGIFAVAHARPHTFHPREMRVLETITKQAALLIENDRLVNEIEYHAVIEERARLAREIHDGLAQTLAFLKLQTAQLQNSLNRGDLKRSREIIRTNHETLSMAYLDARQAIDNLRVAPESDGQHWLEQTVSDFQMATGLEVDLSIKAGDVEFLPEVQAQLIRVAQEALNNVRKHAHATRVEVTLRAWQQDWILEITDNGCGFSADDIPALSQYGLRGMRERAELIGADFQIISQPERGTTVRLRIPNPLEETPV